MQYKSSYKSPYWSITLTADNEGLTGLWIDGQKYYMYGVEEALECNDLPAIKTAKAWLDIYFRGEVPDFKVPVHFIGTDFQKEVWEILDTIPYGQTMTYGEIADILAKRRGIPKMSSRAVGGAVGHNKISIIIPCHRVIGAGGNLTGFGGGIDKKIQLLKIEGAYNDGLYVPKKSTAP